MKIIRHLQDCLIITEYTSEKSDGKYEMQVFCMIFVNYYRKTYCNSRIKLY